MKKSNNLSDGDKDFMDMIMNNKDNYADAALKECLNLKNDMVKFVESDDNSDEDKKIVNDNLESMDMIYKALMNLSSGK